MKTEQHQILERLHEKAMELLVEIGKALEALDEHNTCCVCGKIALYPAIYPQSRNSYCSTACFDRKHGLQLGTNHGTDAEREGQHDL